MLASNGNWKLAPHLRLLNEHLMAVAAGDIKRLMVFMPPRHGKSSLCSQYFPAWYIGRFPGRKILLASYESDFAASWGAKARDVLSEFGEDVFSIKVSLINAAASRWGLNAMPGGMETAGVGAGLTGKGAACLLIDDPVKGAEQAFSKTYRNKAWDWYRSEAYTRLTPRGSIVLTMTRWHEDDLAGRILRESKPGEWTILNLPALAEKGDMLGREEGYPLWPAWYDLEKLVEIKKTMGSLWWAALYQQRPAPADGEVFQRNWIRYYKTLPVFTEVIQSWDMAFKDLKTSAYVCGQVWGKKGSDKYLIHQIREKLDFPGTLRAVRLLTKDYPEARIKLIEDAANGPAIISTLKSEISGIIPIQAKGSKEARASAISPQWESGNVYLPESAYWLEDFIDECITFPNGQYMDQVDTMSQALMRLEDKKFRMLVAK